VDVRYIEKHQIPDHAGPVYLISILENYSGAVWASKVSPTQNQWDYLEVLFAAFSTAGVPKAIVSDGGAIFWIILDFGDFGIVELFLLKKKWLVKRRHEQRGLPYIHLFLNSEDDPRRKLSCEGFVMLSSVIVRPV
jgi:hypothetical protein